jgi:5-methyltetrahydrofolate--homocysteine methyltransferase
MNYLDIENLKNNLSKNPFDELKKSLVLYDKSLAINSVKKLISEKINPTILFEIMTDVIKSVGQAYEEDLLYLPDLIGASETMFAAMPFLEEEIKRTGGKITSLGVIVIGTVLGDIHTIGKQMVRTMLLAEGFTVHDIGVDTSAEKFIDAIKTYNADILAMSALLTTTAYEQKKVISILEKEGLRERVKIMVGGGAVTEEFAGSIGADGYDTTAPGAAKLARRLIGR